MKVVEKEFQTFNNYSSQKENIPFGSLVKSEQVLPDISGGGRRVRAIGNSSSLNTNWEPTGTQLRPN